MERIIPLAIMRMQNALLDLKAETCIAKLMKAESKYGPFVLSSIDAETEIMEEVTDVANYAAMEMMQLDDRYLDEAVV